MWGFSGDCADLGKVLGVWVGRLTYVGVIPGFVENMGTTIYGMAAKYWESVVVGF